MSVRDDDDVKDNNYDIQCGFTTLAWKTKQQQEVHNLHTGRYTVASQKWPGKLNNRKIVNNSHTGSGFTTLAWETKQTTGNWFTLHTLRGAEWFHDTGMESKQQENGSHFTH